MWKRFGETKVNDPHDYYYLSTSYWDAVIFVPKRSVMFHGFGILANPDGKNITYIVKWAIDSDSSENHTVETMDADKDPENKWQTIQIKDLGFKPIKVNEG